MKKIVFVLLAMVSTMATVEAQNVKVKGSVRDAKTGEALPLVNVGLMRQADTVFVRGAAATCCRPRRWGMRAMWKG